MTSSHSTSVPSDIIGAPPDVRIISGARKAPDRDIGGFTVPDDSLILEGKVRTIEPPSGDPEDQNGRYHLIVLEGGGEDGPPTFRLRWPEHLALPITLGQYIKLTVLDSYIQIHRVLHAALEDERGVLLMGLSEDGDTRYAPGWSAEWGDEVGEKVTGWGHQRREFKMTFKGRTAVCTDGWEELVTEDGTFLISAYAYEAKRPEPPKEPVDAPPIPDAGGGPVIPPPPDMPMPCDFSPSYSVFYIIRKA